MLDTLREIGARLMREARPDPKADRDAAYDPSLSPRGAGGDRSFPLDRKAEEIILDGLAGSGEPLSVVSEEAGALSLNGGGGRLVLIDPIDGSKNAATGIPYFGTSIAVAEGTRLGDVTLGYVINLVSGEEFWSIRGGGAFLGGRPVRARTEPVFYLAAYEAQTPRADLPRILPVLAAARRTRCLGAIALDLAYVAAGAVTVLVSPTPTRSFDIAAGWLLVREAGGRITDFLGETLDDIELDLGRTRPVLASANDLVHAEALRLLSQSGARAVDERCQGCG